MVLHPLEFAECYLDSPSFRENIQNYEEELQRTNTQIKHLIKDAKNMLNAFVVHEKMIKAFSNSLQQFQFDCIGENLTDVERGIAGSLKEFGIMLKEVAEEWSHTISRLDIQLISHLEEFRKNQICAYREPKKIFEKASERYYKQLDHTLALSHKKKGPQLQEADAELLSMKRSFHEGALDYVCKLQEVEERKKFEFVEHLLMFMQVYFNYFHQTHETATDCKFYMNSLQEQLVSTREQYNDTRQKTQTLMRKMADTPDTEEYLAQAFCDKWSRAGYLVVMERNQKNPISSRFTSKWSKYFCMYMKEGKVFRMAVAPHAAVNAVSSAMGAKVAALGNLTSNSHLTEEMTVKTCTRKMTDSLERRFCFDLELEDKNGKQFSLTLQAISLEDRQKWMAVMDGKEPNYSFTKVAPINEDLCKLNDIGLQFVTNVIGEIERRGVQHEGIYRLVGVKSKVDLLLQKTLNSDTATSVNYSNEGDWETNTLTSALKSYFRNLPEPIMTFDLHRSFIDAAKCERHEDRVNTVANLISQLPDMNKKMLSILALHLERVQAESETNKMDAHNLGVCFGPTLMRDRQETVQAILEIKFSNIIVYILIEERILIFGGREKSSDVSDKGPDERVTSPRSKTSAHFVKLPSQRYKNRPVGAFYTPTSLPNILENDIAKTASPEKSKFNRQLAIYESKAKSQSPASSSDEAEPEATDLSSGITNSGDSQGAGRLLDQWSPNGQIKSSSSTDMRSKSQYGTSFLKQQHDAAGDKPLPKIRLSPRVRRNRFFDEINSDEEKVPGNTNNSNVRPVLPPKPKSIAMADSLKRHKDKFLNTVKGGLVSSSSSSRTAAKKPKPRKEAAKAPNPLQRSKSAASDLSPVSSGNRRPKSEFIPSAFRVEKIDLLSKVATEGGRPSLNGEIEPNVQPRPVPGQSSDEASVCRSVDDISDDDIRSSVARTLYTCVGEQENELSFQPGQLIRDIRKSEEPGWVLGTLNGQVGLVPVNYIDFL